MTSFTSLLSSIGGGLQAPQPKPSNSAKPAGSAPPSSGSTTTRPTASNTAAGIKRKPDDHASTPQAKVVRTEVKVPVRPAAQTSNSTTPKTAPAATDPPTAYKGTARPSSSAVSARPVAKPVPKPVPGGATPATKPTAPSNGASVPKRGFASIMEKAKAAQEAAKAAGHSTIKHKPVEKLSRRDRQRAQEAAAANQKAGVGMKGAKMAPLSARSRSNTPADFTKSAALQKKAPDVGYKGTMKKAMPEVAYKGTMRGSGPGLTPARPVAKAGVSRNRNDGYVSWSDLDDAEDDEEDYESDASSAMEAGMDDVEEEEARALRAAKREDQEAAEEEERHRLEKLERKKKLLALSKNAAAKRKY